MKPKVFLLSLVLITMSLFVFSKETVAVSYDTEIGLTFTNDVAGSDQSTVTESSGSLSTGQEQKSEKANDKTSKASIKSLLPRTGSKDTELFRWIGALLLFMGFIWLLFKDKYRLKQ
ncbi:LPXTG cell wall anchor domain-containing protein [Enterococcus crotali]|uniref:LPXTG cell wall anchor domain-containing protein n=1 Tax=Enterococcus crotali TaxID=1453587 RepID=UPI00046FD85F|nr:LPXTG cell wall anchor domain-containing protein [Enterococcus crotali]OTP53489.1 hypothetical protein A5881_000386 [Enterococcus termitis]